MNNILKKFKNPVVLTATLANVYILLETVEILNFCGVDETTYMKVVGTIVAILVQIGILVNPNKEDTEEL